MKNKFRIPANVMQELLERDRLCAYCHKDMVYPYDVNNRTQSATIEHLNFDGPFYWGHGLEKEDLVICCASCNSSRGDKRLIEWFESRYCVSRKITRESVSEPVKDYLRRHPSK